MHKTDNQTDGSLQQPPFPPPPVRPPAHSTAITPKANSLAINNALESGYLSGVHEEVNRTRWIALLLVLLLIGGAVWIFWPKKPDVRSFHGKWVGLDEPGELLIQSAGEDSLVITDIRKKDSLIFTRINSISKKSFFGNDKGTEIEVWFSGKQEMLVIMNKAESLRNEKIPEAYRFAKVNEN